MSINQDHLREMIEVISSELELRPLLTIIVQKACELLDADRGSIGLVEPTEEIVRIEAVFRMPEAELGSVCRKGEGLAGVVFRDGKPLLLSRYGSIPDRPLNELEDDCVIGMPIIWRGETIGTFGIGASAPKQLLERDQRALEVFARHAAIAINNARAYQNERIYAVLQERQRLARDLHDNVSQLLFSMSLVAQSIGAAYEKDSGEGEARVSRLMEITALAQNEMSALLAELNSQQASLAGFAREFGLAAALRRHVKLIAPQGATITVNVSDDDTLSYSIREALLRIAQEAVANSIRHGEAGNIAISLETEGNSQVFRVCDDGRGLPAAAPSGPGHMGVRNMEQRAASIGAAFSLAARAPNGACVEVRLAMP